MKLTTGFDFQGYFITEYYDVIFDEMLVGLGLGKALLSTLDNIASSFTGSEATIMVEKLNDAKMALRNRVIHKAEQLGANALIGIDFESSKLGDIIMVSMTATAVRIEKIVSGLPLTERDQKEEEEKKKQEKVRQEQEAWEAAKEEMMRTKRITPDAVIGLVSQLEDSRKMKDVLLEFSQNNPGFFSPDFLKSIDDSVELGRMYGKKLGADNLMKKLKTYLEKLT